MPARASLHRIRLWRSETGAQVVEFGLVILPLLAILFLIMDSAWVIFAKGCLQYAVRQGVRYAVTSQVMPGMGQDDSIRTVVQGSALGFLAGPTGFNKVGIQYYDPNTLQPTMSNAGGNIVQVSVSGVNVSPLGPILRDGAPLVVSAVSSDIVESSPGGIPPSR